MQSMSRYKGHNNQPDFRGMQILFIKTIRLNISALIKTVQMFALNIPNKCTFDVLTNTLSKGAASAKELASLTGMDVKDINSRLYKMLGSKQVTKIEVEGAKAPNWTLNTGDAKELPVKSQLVLSDVEVKILDLLKQSKKPSDAIPTLKLAKLLWGKVGTTSLINGHLYRLAAKGKISKIANPNGTKPRWYLNDSEVNDITDKLSAASISAAN